MRLGRGIRAFHAAATPGAAHRSRHGVRRLVRSADGHRQRGQPVADPHGIFGHYRHGAAQANKLANCDGIPNPNRVFDSHEIPNSNRTLNTHGILDSHGILNAAHGILNAAHWGSNAHRNPSTHGILNTHKGFDAAYRVLSTHRVSGPHRAPCPHGLFGRGRADNLKGPTNASTNTNPDKVTHLHCATNEGGPEGHATSATAATSVSPGNSPADQDGATSAAGHDYLAPAGRQPAERPRAEPLA